MSRIFLYLAIEDLILYICGRCLLVTQTEMLPQVGIIALCVKNLFKMQFKLVISM